MGFHDPSDGKAGLDDTENENIKIKLDDTESEDVDNESGKTKLKADKRSKTNDKKQKKKSTRKHTFWKALLLGILIITIVQLLYGLFLDPNTDLIHRVIVVLTGIIVLILLAMFLRRFWKFLFLFPILLAYSLMLQVLLPDFFVSFFSVLGYITPLVKSFFAFNDTAQLVPVDPNIQNQLSLLKYITALLDFVLAGLVCLFIGLGVSFTLRLFSGKKKSGTILLPFGIVFLLLGAVLLPYAYIGISGSSEYVLNIGIGGANLAAGFQSTQTAFMGGNLTEPIGYFNESVRWFVNAEKILTGLEQLQLFWIMKMLLPDYEIIIDNGIVILKATTSLSRTLSPFLLGASFLIKGITNVGNSLGFGSSTNRESTFQLTAVQDEMFNTGLGELKTSSIYIRNASTYIADALGQLKEIDFQALSADLTSKGQQTLGDVFLQAEDAINVIDLTLKPVIELLSSKVAEFNPPLIQLLRAMKSLLEIEELISAGSYSNVTQKFESSFSNLTSVREVLDSNAYQDVLNYNTDGVNEQILTIYQQLTEVMKFIQLIIQISHELTFIGGTISGSSNKIADGFKTLELDLSVNQKEALTSLKDDFVSANQELHNIQPNVTSVDSRIMNLSMSLEGSHLIPSSVQTNFLNVFSNFNITKDYDTYLGLFNKILKLIEALLLLNETADLLKQLQDDILALSSATSLAELENLFVTRSEDIAANIKNIDGILNESKEVFQLDFEIPEGVTDRSESFQAIQESSDTIVKEIDTIQGSDGLEKMDMVFSDYEGYTESMNNGDLESTVDELEEANNKIQESITAISSQIGTLNP